MCQTPWDRGVPGVEYIIYAQQMWCDKALDKMRPRWWSAGHQVRISVESTCGAGGPMLLSWVRIPYRLGNLKNFEYITAAVSLEEENVKGGAEWMPKRKMWSSTPNRPRWLISNGMGIIFQSMRLPMPLSSWMIICIVGSLFIVTSKLLAFVLLKMWVDIGHDGFDNIWRSRIRVQMILMSALTEV